MGKKKKDMGKNLQKYFTSINQSTNYKAVKKQNKTKSSFNFPGLPTIA